MCQLNIFWLLRCFNHAILCTFHLPLNSCNFLSWSARYWNWNWNWTASVYPINMPIWMKKYNIILMSHTMVYYSNWSRLIPLLSYVTFIWVIECTVHSTPFLLYHTNAGTRDIETRKSISKCATKFLHSCKGKIGYDLFRAFSHIASHFVCMCMCMCDIQIQKSHIHIHLRHTYIKARA